MIQGFGISAARVGARERELKACTVAARTTDHFVPLVPVLTIFKAKMPEAVSRDDFKREVVVLSRSCEADRRYVS